MMNHQNAAPLLNAGRSSDKSSSTHRNRNTRRTSRKGPESATRRGRNRIPEVAREYVLRELAAFQDDELSADFHGRFCYISHRGSPLCRLGYKGGDGSGDWDFAIYRYSREAYGPNEIFMPSYDTVHECVSVAMHAYSLIG